MLCLGTLSSRAVSALVFSLHAAGTPIATGVGEAEASGTRSTQPLYIGHGRLSLGAVGGAPVASLLRKLSFVSVSGTGSVEVSGQAVLLNAGDSVVTGVGEVNVVRPIRAVGTSLARTTQWIAGEATPPFGQWTMPVSSAARITRLNLVKGEDGRWGIDENSPDGRFVEGDDGRLGIGEGATSGEKIAIAPDGKIIIYSS